MSESTLEPTESFLEVVLRPAFAVSFSFTTTSFILLSYFMEKQSYNESSDILFVSNDLWIGVLSYTMAISVSIYFTSSRIRESVVQGFCPPFLPARFKFLPWPISPFSSTFGRRSLISFLIQMLIFPGLLTLLGIHALSYLVTSSFSHWSLPFDLFLASNSLWRLIITSVIFTMNYFSVISSPQNSNAESTKKST